MQKKYSFLSVTQLTTANFLLLVSFLSAAFLSAESQSKTNNIKPEVREPEAATGYQAKRAVHGKEFMIAAANPYASHAGFNILEQGGSAVDAAIAVQLVLTLVEPQSSGIGGGTFMLHWDNKRKEMTTFDGRETAPEKASSDLFLDKQGKALKWTDAVVGGRSVGVPGVMATFKKVHSKYGKLPWSTLFEQAITLAENGFVVSPRLEKLLSIKFNPGIHKLSEINQYFFPNGKSVKAGDILKNSKLARVYRSIAKDGVDVFYQGWIAKKIVDAVQNSKIAPGLLSMKDMAAYQSKERSPVCGPYREFTLCGMAPPSSGGVAVIQILAQLQRFHLENYPVNSGQAIHLYTQSSRLAFADRERYMADDDYVSVPVEGLLSKEYLAKRSALIDPEQDMTKAHAGMPDGAVSLTDGNSIEQPSTSHLSILDAQGNAISMTSSIENAFGSALMVEGFILNNQLTDFSFTPKKNDQLLANRVQANKRPRSSMAPMMIFNKDHSLKLLVGSPGGSRIINYVSQTIIGVLDWQLNPQEAINLPKITNRNYVTTLERGTSAQSLQPLLEAKGHTVRIGDLNSGLHAIELTKSGLVGGADPRREGVVLAK
jgi:gamma-glutamyltranspeptidase/glutathione hydrolase